MGSNKISSLILFALVIQYSMENLHMNCVEDIIFDINLNLMDIEYQFVELCNFHNKMKFGCQHTNGEIVFTEVYLMSDPLCVLPIQIFISDIDNGETIYSH